MGSLPLLVLRHDTPLDASFIRGLVNVYGIALTATAAVGVVSYAFAGRAAIAALLAVLAAVGFAARRGIVSHVDGLRPRMGADDRAAIGMTKIGIMPAP